MNFDKSCFNKGKDSEKRGEKKDNNEDRKGPPKVVNTVPSSSQSLTSSIGIGEFGMKAAKQGNAATFSWAVKMVLFKHIKFLQGPDASLDFNRNLHKTYQK